MTAAVGCPPCASGRCKGHLICRVIYMYFADHNPPHFHAIYAEHEALIQIDDGTAIGGELPRTAARLPGWSSNGDNSTNVSSWPMGTSVMPR